MAISDGIREDRTVDDPLNGIVTFYCRLEGIAVVKDEGGDFLRVTGNDGGTNVEIRIPVAMLEANGWYRSGPMPEKGS